MHFSSHRQKWYSLVRAIPCTMAACLNPSWLKDTDCHSDTPDFFSTQPGWHNTVWLYHVPELPPNLTWTGISGCTCRSQLGENALSVFKMSQRFLIRRVKFLRVTLHLAELFSWWVNPSNADLTLCLFPVTSAVLIDHSGPCQTLLGLRSSCYVSLTGVAATAQFLQGCLLSRPPSIRFLSPERSFLDFGPDVSILLRI